MAKDHPEISAPGMSLTRATIEDVPAIQAIVVAAYTKYIERIGKPPAPMSTDYEQVLQTHDVFVLRAVDEDKTVGSIVLKAEDGSDAIQVNNLVVDPKAQGRGYGRVLMEFAENFAKGKGRCALELFTNVKMYENLGLYPKMGFLETERKTQAGYERVFFRKKLV